jgi:ADP-heptose:LPS heptosyltransferase
MKILALQRRRVGDVLMTTPALRALRARFPQARITFVCEPPFSPALRSNADVETVLSFDSAAPLKSQLRLISNLRQRRFDLALDFEGSAWTAAMAAASGATRRVGFRRSPLAVAYTDRVASGDGNAAFAGAEKLLLLEPLGIDVRGLNPQPAIEPGSRAQDWARRTLESAGIGNREFLLTLAPGARASEYCWPLANFGKLLDLVAATHDFAVVLFPWSGDKSLGAEIARLTAVPLFQLDTTPSLRQMAALLDRADLHVGNESAAKHMASALGTATLTFYAPGMRRRWGSTGDPLQAGLEPPADDGERTASGTPPIARITPESGYAALTALEAYLPRLRASRPVAGAEDGSGPAVPRPGEPRLQGGRGPSGGDPRASARQPTAGEGPRETVRRPGGGVS